MARFFTCWRLDFISWFLLIRQGFEKVYRLGRERLFRMVCIRTSPCFFRSSGTRLIPFSIASLALAILITLPSRIISPLVILPISPNIVVTSSVRPEPISPAIPRISPFLSSKFTPFNISRDGSSGSTACRSLTSNRTPLGLRVLCGKRSFISRPTM